MIVLDKIQKDHEKKKMKKRQEEILNGIMLGDGYAEKRGDKTRIRIRQSLSKERYVTYLFNELKNLTTGKLSKREGKDSCVYISTKSRAEYNVWREKYYIGKKRIKPEELEERLTPLSMAIWIMDDGSMVRSNMMLNTQRYKEEDQLRVLKVLRDKWNIEGSLNKDRDKKRILISAKSTREILIGIVEKEIHESMKY